MESKNILILMMGVLVSAVILAGFVPMFTAVQENAGESITKTNVSNYTEYGEYYSDNFVIVIDNPVSATSIKTSTFTVDGESLSMRESWSRHVILSSDNLVIEIDTSTSNTNLLYLTYTDNDGFVFNKEVPYHNVVTITYDKDAHIITVTDTSSTVNLSVSAQYCFALSNKQDYLFYNTGTQIADTFFSKGDLQTKTDGVISVFAVNLSINGGSDIFTWVISDKSGTRVYYDPLAYDGVINVTLDYVGIHLVDGTTDIYTGGTPTYTFTAENGDTVTPSSSVASRSFVKTIADGHTDSGVMYDLFGLLPLIAGVGLLMSAVVYFLRRY